MAQVLFPSPSELSREKGAARMDQECGLGCYHCSSEQLGSQSAHSLACPGRGFWSLWATLVSHPIPCTQMPAPWQGICQESFLALLALGEKWDL